MNVHALNESKMHVFLAAFGSGLAAECRGFANSVPVSLLAWRKYFPNQIAQV
jgi:hypothetical protein